MVHFEKCNDCCVWMDAGVLSYKRCDRNFDCENCPLDSVLQTEVPDALRRTVNNFEHVSAALPAGVSEESAALLAPYATTVLHRDFQYTDGHVWIQALPGGYYRLGLDALFLRLLPDATDVITLATGSSVPESGPLGWVYLDGMTQMMRSPIAGTIVRRNSAINRVNATMRNTPYSESWLAVLKSPSDDAHISGNCNSFQFALQQRRNEMDAFLGSAATALAGPDTLGPCMNDGGTRIDSLEHALGEKVYREIVKNVLNLGPA